LVIHRSFSVGEPQLASGQGLSVVKAKEGSSNKATMDIYGKAEGDGASFKYNGKSSFWPPKCIFNSTKGIPIPKVWPIDESNHLGLQQYYTLFVFHLLPQSATRKFEDGLMTDKPHEGTPKCIAKGQLTFKFVS
jgi:hypothetical protein